MSRAISYSAVATPTRAFGIQVATGGGNSKAPDDGYTERLAKYIPAETLAFFVPLAAVIGTNNPTWLWVIVVAELVGTPLYLWLDSRSLPTDKRPLPHYYVLATVAFVIWALGVAPNFAKLLGLPEIGVTVTMGLAVFFFPAIDKLLAAWGV